MEILKKNKAYLSLCAAFIAFICIWICFGAGMTVGSGSLNLYELTFGDTAQGGVITAWLFLLFGLIAAGCAGAMVILKKFDEYAKFVNFAAAVFFLISAILYFCTTAFVGFGNLGAGAIFNGILLILACLVSAVAGVVDFLK